MTKTSSLLALLEDCADPRSDPLTALTALVAGLRPAVPGDIEAATRAIQALCHLLERRPDLREGAARTLVAFVAGRRAVSLYADAGVFPNRGFAGETARRLSHMVLPDDADPTVLKDAVGLIFDRASDAGWMRAVPDGVWVSLLRALRLDEAVSADSGTALVEGMLEALRVISHRIAAIGLEPELVRVEPSLEYFESPFIAQSEEMTAFVDSWRRWRRGDLGQPDDGRHLHVLFDQGRKLVGRVRTRAAREGTSLSLTLLLERLGQHLDRAEAMLAVLDGIAGERRLDDALPAIVALFKTLVGDECRRNDVKSFWRASVELLALRVTDNVSRAGEHYITESRREYLAMFGSAALAGVIIALMAAGKLAITGWQLPPLVEAFLVCLNYGLGFVLIHVLHGTVATKLPAMTAATIAASLGEGGAKTRDLDQLAALIVRTVRSQTVAILGNISVALPLSIGIAYLLAQGFDGAVADADKAQALLAEVHPWAGGTLFYAAVAGVCLFLAGLISGYYDNLAAYNRIPQRLRAHRGARALLGEARLRRVAHYVEDNLGALAGNFFFGFLIGGVAAIGTLSGLPLDIRHITFGSAFSGYALQALDFALAWREALVLALGLALIGLVNLTVSFALSLWVACRARRVSLAEAVPVARSLARLLRTTPAEFVLPPPTTALR
jgi:site-specific recombinase